jgi:membrane-associated phospholipid phosphatase
VSNFMKFISGLFHPLLLASYFLLFLYFYHPVFFSPIPLPQVPKLLFASFVTTFVIPVLSILIMRFTSRISSLSLNAREERLLPFISIFLFYASTTYLYIFRLGMKPPLSSMTIAMSILIGILLLTTIWFKISIHAAAVWALAGLMAGILVSFPEENLIYKVTATFLIAGLVSSSRLYLGRHTKKEVWSGTFLGFTIGFLSVLISG